VWSTTVSGIAITPEYTNAWFTDGQELMLSRARFFWYSRFDRNKDQSIIAMGDYRTELDRLRFQSRKYVKPRPTRPWV
jgi:hypothetical protein